ncbi:MAG TPA: hypothetical protein ENF37_02040 [Beggiatoa sp.]|nr:MAG: hypothetical protein B6247_18795 [Beggiatoa sp. 4572_84]RKZ59355.1 MAG: hypothetical protein DRR08_14180 [Gammaproteobacteria bacterium]HEW97413.1 hypothetical protein [Beggiatoa sp.]
MNNLRLTDLDELVLLVKDKVSLSYILEAVDTYRTGAYRAAIVSTWIAVSYDIITKIREFASQGDNNAKAFIEQMNRFITEKDVIQLQIIEQKLLKTAYTEFELLSSIEYQDLVRLQHDRHLCAHPAFAAEEEDLFQPTPELVRVHLVHAIKHLLQHSPLQGKKALSCIMEDIKRPSFPSELEAVYTFLHTKYLKRAKETLVRSLIIVLLKTLLRNDEPKLTLLNALSCFENEHCYFQK